MGLHPLPPHVTKCVENQFLTTLIQKFVIFCTLWFRFLRFGIWSVSVCHTAAKRVHQYLCDIWSEGTIAEGNKKYEDFLKVVGLETWKMETFIDFL